MDYTPISARRVVIGFSMTGFVALLPLLFLVLETRPLPAGLVADSGGVVGALVLGLVSVVLTTAVVALIALTVVTARRAARRPSRA